MRPKSNVTVIMPCYNDGKYVMQAVHSVLNQTLKPEKVIIVDDGSGPETKTVLKQINFENIEVIHQDNQGVCVARNNGIKLAQTKYILNLDADDYFEPSFIEKAVKVLNEHEEVGVVGCFYRTLKNNKIEQNIIKPLGGSVENFLVKNNGLGNALFRLKCWEQVLGYDEKMAKGYEDWDFWISILAKGWNMHIIQEPLFTYRIKQVSRDSNAMQNHDIELKTYLFKKHQKLYLDNFQSFANQMFYVNNRLKKEKLKSLNSLDYKIGNIILVPFRFLKKWIK
ncbi:glycosyltransferase family A protein [Tamlana crocina]|uniref:Glycosyltransferase family 2 protein n=1 Tax=Tamlana crocina TaxID=393006 RepID=A0ABX1DCV0_9FLAO|nr:glycosyltransferase family A protein [Tamlana crocina]NJX15036.1 glycosyltransferase family 2 protein [Tamlana crocina]